MRLMHQMGNQWWQVMVVKRRGRLGDIHVTMCLLCASHCAKAFTQICDLLITSMWDAGKLGTCPRLRGSRKPRLNPGYVWLESTWGAKVYFRILTNCRIYKQILPIVKAEKTCPSEPHSGRGALPTSLSQPLGFNSYILIQRRALENTAGSPGIYRPEKDRQSISLTWGRALDHETRAFH